MAAPFITVTPSDSATHSRRLLKMQASARDLMSDLEEFIAESYQMFDGSGAEQFTLPKIKYGVGTNAEAQAIFDMLNGTLADMKKVLVENGPPTGNAVALATRVG